MLGRWGGVGWGGEGRGGEGREGEGRAGEGRGGTGRGVTAFHNINSVDINDFLILFQIIFFL